MNKRTFTRIWRWSLIVTVPIAAFWTWFYLTYGFIPSSNLVFFVYVQSIALVKLPFVVSRWFDFLIAPIWISVMMALGTDWAHKTLENVEARDILVGVAWIFVFLSFLDALFMGIATGLVSTLIIVAFTILIVLLIKALELVGRGLSVLYKWANG